MTRTTRTIGIGTTAALLLLAACEPASEAPEAAAQQEFKAASHFSRALLRDASGNSIGWILFSRTFDGTLVSISARLPDAMGTIHGLHVHANDNPANGEGCVADPAQPASTHFVSVDGHYNPSSSTHGDHSGDMPALSFTHAGSARMTFVTDRFTPQELKGKAVILHQGPDNYGNVPVGAAPNQYTPNSAEATTLTHNTGNAGARIGCGVIH